jgi:hypothetical protein
MGKLEFRRLKYPLDRKRKVQLFYFDMRIYLEDAYKQYEYEILSKNSLPGSKRIEPSPEGWIDFNKDFRKSWKLKPFSADQKRYSAIKEGAKTLY